MGKPSRATQAKRNRERSNQERQEEKRAERAVRNEQRKAEAMERAASGLGDIDPDLIGIYPGPQPIHTDD